MAKQAAAVFALTPIARQFYLKPVTSLWDLVLQKRVPSRKIIARRVRPIRLFCERFDGMCYTYLGLP